MTDRVTAEETWKYWAHLLRQHSHSLFDFFFFTFLSGKAGTCRNGETSTQVPASTRDLWPPSCSLWEAPNWNVTSVLGACCQVEEIRRLYRRKHITGNKYTCRFVCKNIYTVSYREDIHIYMNRRPKDKWSTTIDCWLKACTVQPVCIVSYAQ